MSIETQELLQTILIRTMLVSMMFSMGLGLTVGALASVGKRIGLVAWIVLANFVVSPLLAALLIQLFGVGPEAAAGIIVCSCAPGSTVAALLARNAGGSVPTAVAVLLLLIATSLLFTPFIVDAMLARLGEGIGTFERGAALLTILTFQIVPLCVGMVVLRLAPELASSLEPWAARFATALLLIIVVAFTITQGHLIQDVGWATAGCIAVIIVLSLLAGALFPGSREVRTSIAYASGSKNIALSTLLAEQYLADVAFLSVLIFGLLTYLILIPATPLVALWVRGHREKASQ